MSTHFPTTHVLKHGKSGQFFFSFIIVDDVVCCVTVLLYFIFHILCMREDARLARWGSIPSYQTKKLLFFHPVAPSLSFGPTFILSKGKERKTCWNLPSRHERILPIEINIVYTLITNIMDVERAGRPACVCVWVWANLSLSLSFDSTRQRDGIRCEPSR